MFFVRYAAASVVLLLLSVSAFLVLNRGAVENQKLASGTVQADTTHTEVTLIIGDQETVQVEDNALIAYNSDITVQSTQKKRKSYQGYR